MVKKYWKLIALVAVLGGFLGLMITDWRPQSKSAKPIRVMTSLNFYGEVAKAVAGEHGQVTSLIDSSAVDTHDYQPTAKQARQLATANVAIENGLGYDQWMNKMVKATDHKLTVVNVAKDVAQKHAGDNEHVWYQPATMQKLATQLAADFSKLDPKHKDEYQANARAYQKRLDKLNAVIETAKAGVGANNRVAVSEPVFDYALSNLGYEIANPHFEKAVEDDNDPSPHDIAQLRYDIKNHRIAFFVNNAQESDQTVKNLVKLAHENDVPVLSVTETKPDGEDYVSWMTKQYQALIKIQRGE